MRKRAPGNLMLKPWFELEEIRRNGIKEWCPQGKTPTS